MTDHDRYVTEGALLRCPECGRHYRQAYGCVCGEVADEVADAEARCDTCSHWLGGVCQRDLAFTEPDDGCENWTRRDDMDDSLPW